jgi:hypothetical protein
MTGPLGGLRADPATHLVGALSLIASMTVYAMALEALRRERHAMSAGDVRRVWWFGYTRDLMNILGLVLIAMSHYLLGFPGPLALLAGFFTSFACYLLDFGLAQVARARRRGFWALVGIMVLLNLPTLIAPRAVVRTLEGVVLSLFY